MAILPIQRTFSQSSRLVYGCMGLGGSWGDTPYSSEHLYQAQAAIDAALEIGINFFDHADIYTRGKAEQVFGEVLKQRSGLREQVILQSKCAIRFPDEQGCGRYDWSADYIRHSVEQSLQRLQSDYLDILLLHRPDPLAEMDEVAKVLSELKAAGKVRHFGVSNMNAAQLNYLQSVLDFPIIINQLQLNLSHYDWLEQGVGFNNQYGKDLCFVDGILEHCAMNNIQIQAWGSLSQGIYTGRNIDDQPETVKQTAQLVQDYAAQLQCSCEAVVLAWVMRHPLGLQPVIGSANAHRIKACGDAEKINLSREQWYELYLSSRGAALP